jgi:hypothetical protein
VFNSQLRDPLTVQSAPDEKLELVNAPGPQHAPGAETLIHYEVGSLQIIGSWSYINATETAVSGLPQGCPCRSHQQDRLRFRGSSANFIVALKHRRVSPRPSSRRARPPCQTCPTLFPLHREHCKP